MNNKKKTTLAASVIAASMLVAAPATALADQPTLEAQNRLTQATQAAETAVQATPDSLPEAK